jgi:hypothetical protein
MRKLPALRSPRGRRISSTQQSFHHHRRGSGRWLRSHLVTCPGGLIVHVDGTIAGYTLDEDEDGCRGRELRHQGESNL